MLWIGEFYLLQDGFRKVPTTAPYSFVDQLNTARRFMWNKAAKVRRTVDTASHIIVGGICYGTILLGIDF